MARLWRASLFKGGFGTKIGHLTSIAVTALAAILAAVGALAAALLR